MHKFNEARQRAYVLGARGREILLIQQSIQLIQEESKEISFGIQYMRPLASIYSHRDPEFMKTQVRSNPIQKRNSNPKRKVQPRLSVDRPGRPRLPESEVTSVGRPGPVDRSFLCTPVHAGRRPPLPVDRDVDREYNWPAPYAVSRSFVVRSLCYLLPSPLSPLSHTNTIRILLLGFLTQAHWLQAFQSNFNSTEVFALYRSTTKKEISLQSI